MVGDHWWTYDWTKGLPAWLKTTEQAREEWRRQALKEAGQLELPFNTEIAHGRG